MAKTSLDLLATTIAGEPEDTWANTMLLRSYAFQSLIGQFKTRDYRGTTLNFNVAIYGDAGDSSGSDARARGIGRTDGGYDTIPIKEVDSQVQGLVPWCSYLAGWSIKSKDILLNASKSGFVDLGKSKREVCGTRFANILEWDFWSPTSYLYENDERPMLLGPEYWITDDGYHINDAGGTLGTKVGGIDPTNSLYNDPLTGVNRWRNQYKQVVSANELVDALDYMFLQCKFEAPPNVSLNTAPQYKRKIISNLNGFLTWKKLMRRLSEPFSDEKPMFNGVAIEHAAGMTARSDGTNQIFFMDLRSWEGSVARGYNMKKNPVFTPEAQPGVRAQFIEHWPTVACGNRQTQGKIFGFGNEMVES